MRRAVRALIFDSLHLTILVLICLILADVATGGAWVIWLSHILRK